MPRWGLIIRLWDGSYTTFLVLVSWAFFSGSTTFTWMSVLDLMAGENLGVKSTALRPQTCHGMTAPQRLTAATGCHLHSPSPLHNSR